jgi:putative acetyltransferase
MDLIVREELPGEHTAIREVHRLAFGGDDEGRLVDALREGGFARVSQVAVDDGQIVGHILFSELPIVTSRGTVDALSLAPLAVIPNRQRQGIGSILTLQGLRTCADRGYRIVLVVGHPEFYARFGFSPQLAQRLNSPYSGAAFMALELVPEALTGVEGEVHYPPPFQVL